MGGWIVSTQIISAFEFSLCVFPVPLEAQFDAGVGFGVGREGLRKIVFRREVVCCEAEVTIDDCRVGEGVVRIEGDGVSEVPDGFFDARSRVLAPVISTFEIRLISFGIFCIPCGNSLFLLACLLKLQSRQHLACDRVLNF